MKKYYSENEELNGLLINNGIDLICNANMDIIISDEDAERIDEIVKELAPASMSDYSIEDYTKEIEE